MEGFWKRPPSRYNTLMSNPDPTYPWPCDQPRSLPSSPNKHVIVSFIKAYQSKGDMKKCAHLKIPEAPLIQLQPWESIPSFEPHCEENSFDFHNNEDGKQCFYGCPKDCECYKSAWWSQVKESCHKLYWSIRDGVIGIFQYLASLSPWVQAIIVIALLAVFGLLEIVKPYLPK